MHSRLLVSGLPRSLPPLPPCLPCVEGQQRTAPHSSSFPPTTAPLQALHKDMWGPARVSGQGHERYFLLVVDDYTRYTTVFPLRSKGEVPDVLIPWIRAVRLQRRKDLPVLRLHSDRGGPPPIEPPLPQGPTPSGVSQVDPLSLAEPVEVAVDSGSARGAASGGVASWGAEPASAEPGGAEPEGAEPGAAETEGAESGGAGPEGAEPGGTEPEGTEPTSADSEGAESGLLRY
ncbi:unnamed protein product [Closterium sp. NIES-53]